MRTFRCSIFFKKLDAKIMNHLQILTETLTVNRTRFFSQRKKLKNKEKPFINKIANGMTNDIANKNTIEKTTLLTKNFINYNIFTVKLLALTWWVNKRLISLDKNLVPTFDFFINTWQKLQLVLNLKKGIFEKNRTNNGGFRFKS